MIDLLRIISLKLNSCNRNVYFFAKEFIFRVLRFVRIRLFQKPSSVGYSQ